MTVDVKVSRLLVDSALEDQQSRHCVGD